MATSAPMIIANDDDALAAIRCLHSDKRLLLLSPTVKSHTNKYSFDPLRRGIERHHAAVKNVPYVPSAGLTKIHQQVLASEDTAAAVVVVAVGDVTQTEQEEFAEVTWQIANECMPMILVLISSDCARSSACGFKTVLRCGSSSSQALGEAAELIFRG